MKMITVVYDDDDDDYPNGKTNFTNDEHHKAERFQTELGNCDVNSPAHPNSDDSNNIDDLNNDDKCCIRICHLESTMIVTRTSMMYHLITMIATRTSTECHLITMIVP